MCTTGEAPAPQGDAHHAAGGLMHLCAPLMYTAGDGFASWADCAHHVGPRKPDYEVDNMSNWGWQVILQLAPSCRHVQTYHGCAAYPCSSHHDLGTVCPHQAAPGSWPVVSRRMSGRCWGEGAKAVKAASVSPQSILACTGVRYPMLGAGDVRCGSGPEVVGLLEALLPGLLRAIQVSQGE